MGDRIGRLVGAAAGQVVVGDSTSVQLYKLLVAAIDAHPSATTVAVAADEFPTDRYVVDGVARARGLEVRTVPTDGVDGPITAATVAAACPPGDVAVLVASAVRFRTAALADVTAVTAAAHAAGALVLWDLSHAVGSVPIELDRAGADLAVGCTYKYLNAGPGAPAFAYRAHRHRALLQPIHGWFGHADQFSMGATYEPFDDARQLLVGSAPVAGLLAVDEGAALHEEVGLAEQRDVSIALTGYAMDLADALLAPHGVEVATPRDPSDRGSHVALRHRRAADLVARLATEGIVVDHRAPDVIRVAAAPLHTRFVDLFDAVDGLRRALEG